jgi:hypothetical protein
MLRGHSPGLEHVPADSNSKQTRTPAPIFRADVVLRRMRQLLTLREFRRIAAYAVLKSKSFTSFNMLTGKKETIVFDYES